MEIRQFDTYEDMQAAHQKDVDAFPMLWMFGAKQATDEELAAETTRVFGEPLTLNDLTGIFAGGAIRKSDKKAFEEMFERHDLEKKQFSEDFNNLVSMIEAEMWNHEYGYTGYIDETLMALGWTAQDVNSDERKQKAVRQAHLNVMEWYESHREE